MSSKLKLLKVTIVFFIVCIMSAGNLMTDNTVQADKSYKNKKHRQNCHKHWHKHNRDSAHRHKHCHHHEHERERRGHGDDHDRGRRRDHDDDYDRGHDDNSRDDHSRNEGGNGRIVVPRPPVIKPPKPPTPWSIAKKIGKRVHFSNGDRRQIKKYYRKPARQLQALAPPSPPPGIDNLARRGAILPPALKVPGLSSRLKRKLSALPSRHKYGRLGRMVIIYDARTRIIKDVKKAF